MAGIDFQAILDSMSAGNVSNDPIRSIYEILPIYDNDQQHLLSSKVLQNLLSAYTQNEYLRGIKVSTLNNVTDVQQE